MFNIKRLSILNIIIIFWGPNIIIVITVQLLRTRLNRNIIIGSFRAGFNTLVIVGRKDNRR